MPLTFPCCVVVVSTFGLRPRGGDLPGGKEAAHNNNNSIPLVHGLVSGKQRLYSFLLPSVPLAGGRPPYSAVALSWGRLPLGRRDCFKTFREKKSAGKYKTLWNAF